MVRTPDGMQARTAGHPVPGGRRLLGTGRECPSLDDARAMAEEALRGLQARISKRYAKTGRPSIAPEKLLRALLLQVLYSVRSERMLMEQLDYNLLFRWFVGLNPDDAVWDVTVFTKNRERMRYDEYLAKGYPIASGVIEGACRHVVKDRMERTGMSWCIPGAQAMLHLRAVYLNGRCRIIDGAADFNRILRNE